MDEDDAKTVNDKYTEIFDINTAIVGFTRQKIIEARGLAELHRQAADAYDEIADSLAEMAYRSAEILAKGIAVEAGLREEEDEDDEEDD